MEQNIHNGVNEHGDMMNFLDDEVERILDYVGYEDERAEQFKEWIDGEEIAHIDTWQMDDLATRFEEHALEEALEDIAAEVADQDGKWTVSQRQRYNHLKHGN